MSKTTTKPVRWWHAFRHRIARLWTGTPPRLTAGRDPDDLGRLGEDQACAFLSRAGYRVVGRNLLTSSGEIDVLCHDPGGRVMVVVEVKSRRSAHHQPPPEAGITAAKRRKLLILARGIARANRWTGPVRIDVVAVDWPEQGPPVIRHFVNAVSER